MRRGHAGISRICIVVFLCISASLQAQPKNVILFIGDGMGLNHITTARIDQVGVAGRLMLDTFPVVGLVTTHSRDKYVTDSAASATALACGVKTNNAMLGQLPDGTAAPSLTELAKRAGMRTGIVTDVQVTHATPGGFLVHHKSRNDQDRIAELIAACNADLVMGGGLEYWIPKTEQGSKRTDYLDIRKSAEEHGFSVQSALGSWVGLKRVLCLLQREEIKHVEGEPGLADMIRTAIEFLNRGDSGFFLMIEGGQIDWESHDNKMEPMLHQMRQFDAAVRAAVDMLGSAGETLILITADHETGGLLIRGGDRDSQVGAAFTHGNHSGSMVGLYAMGPGAERFAGTLDNTEIPRRIWTLLGHGEEDFLKENSE